MHQAIPDSIDTGHVHSAATAASKTISQMKPAGEGRGVQFQGLAKNNKPNETCRGGHRRAISRTGNIANARNN